MKKESAKRGYMTPAEVEEHLKNISSSYEGGKAKIAYLQKVLSKEKLLAPTTRNSVRQVLVNKYRAHHPVDADKVLIEMGGEYRIEGIKDLTTRRRDPEAAEVLANNNEFEAAAHIYASIGYDEYNQPSTAIDFDKADKSLTRAAELYERAGKLEYAADAVIRSHVGTHSGEVLEGTKYGALIEKAAEEQQVLSKKVHYLQEAQERYQVAGKTARALAIGKKLSLLEAKHEAEKTRRGYAAIGISGVGLFGGASFLSSNVTGNAISNLSNTTSSWIGGVLILIGVVALGFWIKNKKSKKK